MGMGFSPYIKLVSVSKGTGFSPYIKLVSVSKGTGFSPYIKLQNQAGFSRRGNPECFSRPSGVLKIDAIIETLH